MNGGNKLKDMIKDMDLTSQPLPGLPIVEIAGQNRVLVENHRGVCKYSSETVCVKVGFGQIEICGCCLTLKRMTSEQLIISGRINSVSLIRREKHDK